MSPLTIAHVIVKVMKTRSFHRIPQRSDKNLCSGVFRNCHLHLCLPRYDFPAYMDETRGYANVMFKHMRRVNNITFNLSIAPDKQFGGMRSNGSFYGAVGMIANRRADISITAFTYLLSRFKVRTSLHSTRSVNWSI